MNPATKDFIDRVLQESIQNASRVPVADPNENVRFHLQELARRKAAVQAKLQTELANASNRTFASHVPNQLQSGNAPMNVGSAGFQKALQQLIAASGGQLKITSGTRSRERQTQLWNAALKKYGSAARARKWVAPPGRSRHESGLAADLGGNLAWAHANAAKYGLHFPMAHERWHIEPLGSRR